MDFPADIVRFIEQRFSRPQIAKVYALLKSKGLDKPSVTRAVLYLSNGSFARLELLADKAKENAKDLLLQAEYETDFSHTPMRLHDMAKPFDDEENLGPDCFQMDAAKPRESAPRRLTARSWKLLKANPSD